MPETKEQKATRMRAYNQRPAVKKRAAARTKSYRIKWNALVRLHRDKPCVDCGVKLPPEIMEFDHLDEGTKRFEFCHASSFKLNPGETRLAAILAEIAKCVVRCPNCHKLRHFRGNNGHFSWRASQGAA